MLVTLLNDDGFFRSTAGTATTEVTIQPKPCDGSEGTPVFNGCGISSSWPPANRMGEEMSITFSQPSGGICGGTWTISMNMPGEFVSAPGGTINGRSASFPDGGARTTRSAVYRLSDKASDYTGLRTCPRALGYYEFPSSTTGPYIYIRNGAAHDLLPFVVNP